MDRRTFLKSSALLGGAALHSPVWLRSAPAARPVEPTPAATPVAKAQVAFVKTRDRVAGVNQPSICWNKIRSGAKPCF